MSQKPWRGEEYAFWGWKQKMSDFCIELKELQYDSKTASEKKVEINLKRIVSCSGSN